LKRLRDVVRPAAKRYRRVQGQRAHLSVVPCAGKQPLSVYEKLDVSAGFRDLPGGAHKIHLAFFDRYSSNNSDTYRPPVEPSRRALEISDPVIDYLHLS